MIGRVNSIVTAPSFSSSPPLLPHYHLALDMPPPPHRPAYVVSRRRERPAEHPRARREGLPGVRRRRAAVQERPHHRDHGPLGRAALRHRRRHRAAGGEASLTTQLSRRPMRHHHVPWRAWEHQKHHSVRDLSIGQVLLRHNIGPMSHLPTAALPLPPALPLTLPLPLLRTDPSEASGRWWQAQQGDQPVRAGRWLCPPGEGT